MRKLIANYKLDEKYSINKHFDLKNKIFFKKKKPNSEKYPFEIIDPFDIFQIDNLPRDFYLVGENWKKIEAENPVAICWGFNDWKLGFFSDYLNSYRTAFAPRKIGALSALRAINSFPIKPEAFFIWGYTEPAFIKIIAKKLNIKIFRVEDGFVRSANLGASHATPYSLVIDSTGLYYNPEEPSDIENILNTYNLSAEELNSASVCMRWMKDFSVTKYNTPSASNKNNKNVKIRKKVAVLGQVDDDASIKMGNFNNWTPVELIRLAKKEHPDADIIYRPHPDIYFGYKKSKHKHKNVLDICEISSPEISFVEFISDIDHVYTITSLSGLEALIYGKKVTVVGAPFYAGWGLTDDRVSLPRRNRKRTLNELFYCIYLKYPKYLIGGTPEIDFISTILRIKGDQKIAEFDNYIDFEKKNDISLDYSNFWPRKVFLKKETDKIDAKFCREFLDKPRGKLFDIFFSYSISGAVFDKDERNIFLNIIRNHIDADVYNSLLLDLYNISPANYIASQFSWILSKRGTVSESLDFLSNHLKYIDCNDLNQSHKSEKTLVFNLEDSPGDSNRVFNGSRITIDQADTILNIIENLIEIKKFDEAIDKAKILLLHNYHVSNLLHKFVKISEIKFDNKSAKLLADFSQRIDLYASNRSMSLSEVRNADKEFVYKNKKDFIVMLVKLVVLKPDVIDAALFFVKKYKEYLDEELLSKVLKNSLLLDNQQSVRKALGYIALQIPDKSIKILENIIRQGGMADNVIIAYSQALSAAGRINEARNHVNNLFSRSKSISVFRELLRLMVISGDYVSSLKTIKYAEAHKIYLGDMHLRKSYFGNKMIKEAFETFREIKVSKNVALYYPEKYQSDFRDLSLFKNIIFLAIYGPGDEIRFASIYKNILEKFNGFNVTITCDPRLFTIFSRSFPSLNFLGVSRPRTTDFFNYRDYCDIPGSEIMAVIDNNAHNKIMKSDAVAVVSDMLSVFLKGYEDFSGASYIKPDSDLIEKYKSKLIPGKKYVGLSWRSSLTTHSRNEHYLTIEELSPLFEIEDIQFVNFQYDECLEELSWIESVFPGKMINFSDIDHYNDFESVAALMKNMDLIIAPATTVVELAGALGCQTWLISNSSELHWRKVNDEKLDVWHSSVKHIEGSILGDKKSLVETLVERLKLHFK